MGAGGGDAGRGASLSPEERAARAAEYEKLTPEEREARRQRRAARAAASGAPPSQ
jgi:membrane fusion protein, multidrug efflux system